MPEPAKSEAIYKLLMSMPETEYVAAETGDGSYKFFFKLPGGMLIVEPKSVETLWFLRREYKLPHTEPVLEFRSPQDILDVIDAALNS